MSRKSKVSTEIKVQAVEDYLRGIKSLSEISNELNIYKSAISILQQWIKKYNGHKIFKSHSTEVYKLMTKGRKKLMKK